MLFEAVEELKEAVNGQCGEKEGDSKSERVNEEKADAAIYGTFCGCNHEY